MISLMAPMQASAQSDSAELTFWESVRDSDDVAEFEAYLEAYPGGKFAPLAKIRLKKLKTNGETKVKSAPGAAVSPEDKRPKIVNDGGRLGTKIKDAENDLGAVIQEIVANSPAAGSDLKINDTIQKIDGRTVKNAKDVSAQIFDTAPGKEVQLTVLRNGRTQQISVTLGSLATALLAQAEGGHPPTMKLLGDYLSEGKLFEKDPALATVWYRKARDAWKEKARSQTANDKANVAKGERGGIANRVMGVPKHIGSHGDWSAWLALSGKDLNRCFVSARPRASMPKNADRAQAYAYLSDFPADGVRNELSIKLGIELKSGSDVELTIGENKFSLFTKGEHAFTRRVGRGDAEIVEAMKKANKMVVSGQSKQGLRVEDTYSLSGLTAALEALRAECK